MKARLVGILLSLAVGASMAALNRNETVKDPNAEGTIAPAIPDRSVINSVPPASVSIGEVLSRVR